MLNETPPPFDWALIWVSHTIRRDYEVRGVFPVLREGAPLALRGALALHVVSPYEASAPRRCSRSASLSPVQLGADVFALGLALALPFTVLLLFMNLVLGVISRVAPQFNVFAVGFPVTIGAGLILLATGFPLLEAPLTEATQRVMSLMR